MLVFSVTGGGGKQDAASSSGALTVVTADSSIAPAESSQSPQSTVQTEAASSAAETSSPAADTDSREYRQYSFRSKKYLNTHFEKHGSEFGDITVEEYLRLANDMLNSDSDTILHKTEKEDGDDVYFDTATGYFLVLSTDGYIRTFFIPDRGIEYYKKQ